MVPSVAADARVSQTEVSAVPGDLPLSPFLHGSHRHVPGPQGRLRGAVLFRPGEVDAHPIEREIAEGVGQCMGTDAEDLELLIPTHVAHLSEAVIGPLPGDVAVARAPEHLTEALIGKGIGHLIRHVRSPQRQETRQMIVGRG